MGIRTGKSFNSCGDIESDCEPDSDSDTDTAFAGA
jgi:hypothetical protein